MRLSRFGKRLAFVSTALLFVSPASAQTAPRQMPPIIRQIPPVAQPTPPPTQPAPPRVAPLRPSTAQAGTVNPQPGTDADGDGHVDSRVPIRAGVGAPWGDDCDDSDASRYAGATEIANTLDEDCNDTTIGTLDADNDGFTSYLVSNPGGTTGLDCNDAEAGIRPDAQELPNRIDDNCDGIVDNVLGTWWTPR